MIQVLTRWWVRLEAASRSPRLVLGLTIVASLVALVTLLLALRSPDLELRISAGHEAGRRHEVAEVLVRLAEERGLRIVLIGSQGSADAIRRIERGSLDGALVQGGLPPPSVLREVAPLSVEPLHLLVRDPGVRRLEDLRNRTLDLGPEGSGTRELSLELLRMVHMEPGRDFDEDPLSYDELLSKPLDQLPDAFFTVSTMPSPIAEHLVRRRHYRFIALPYADALQLRDVGVRGGVIPAYAYGVSPAHPPEDTPTIATQMLVVAHRDTPNEAVHLLLEVISSDSFRRAAQLPPVDHEALVEPELTLHEGSREWLARNDPLITPELIDNVESLRSFLVSLGVALFLAWRWFRARQQSGFERYLHQVTDLEREVLKLELEADLDLPRLLRIQRRLGALKNEALEGYGAGRIGSAQLLNSFLAHVTDVRTFLNALILHERERLEKKARRAQDEDAVRRELWRNAIAALGDETEDDDPR